MSKNPLIYSDKDNTNEILKLSETIRNSFKSYNDRTSFIFLCYYKLHIDNICYFERTKKLKFKDVDNFLEIYNTLIHSYAFRTGTKYDIEMINRIKKNDDTLGLKDFLHIYKTKKDIVETISNTIFNLDFTILDLMNLFELISQSDKSLNDFFTPDDISSLVNEIGTKLIKENYKDKDRIVIYDSCCGVGKMLYSTFISLKEKYQDKEIVVLGADIFPKYAVFCSAVFNLINRKNKFVIADTLLTNPFSNVKVDLYVGNPPFGNIPKETQTKIIQLKEYRSRNTKDNVDIKKELKKLNVKPLTKEEYLKIINDYEIV